MVGLGGHPSPLGLRKTGMKGKSSVEQLMRAVRAKGRLGGVLARRPSGTGGVATGGRLHVRSLPATTTLAEAEPRSMPTPFQLDEEDSCYSDAPSSPDSSPSLGPQTPDDSELSDSPMSLEGHRRYQMPGAAQDGAAERPKSPRMWSAIIRVYENRFVRVTVMRNSEQTAAMGHSSSSPSTSPSATTRALALTSILASAAAFAHPSRIAFKPGTACKAGAALSGPMSSMLDFARYRLSSPERSDFKMKQLDTMDFFGSSAVETFAVWDEFSFFNAAPILTR